MNTSPTPTEIAKCPNPECGNPCKLSHTSGKNPWYFVRCTLPETGKLRCCDYRGPRAMDKEEAIRLHNLICTHPHGPGLCVDCDDSGPIYSDTQIKYMVDRFLVWRLPENFNPDAGISFERTFNEHTPYPMKHEPVGTNLFDASQATEMVRYMVEGMPGSPAPETQAVAYRNPETGHVCSREKWESMGSSFRQGMCQPLYRSPVESVPVACNHNATMTETFPGAEWCADCGAIRAKGTDTWYRPTCTKYSVGMELAHECYTKKDVEVLLEIERQTIIRSRQAPR